jgi:hypothetical protein
MDMILFVILTNIYDTYSINRKKISVQYQAREITCLRGQLLIVGSMIYEEKTSCHET